MKIHRFKCSETLNNEIMAFAEIHKFDTTDILKEQWTDWMETETIKDLVDQESTYLSRHDYDTPIHIKIFKSIKYYYIKKFLSIPVKKKKRESEPQRISNEIMADIKADLKHHFDKNPEFKPADTYELFKKIDDPLIKKSYKNQYYQMKNKSIYK